MARIDYFFSLLSPFTYLAGTRLEEIAVRHGATIAYKPYDILALFDRLGTPRPADRPQGRKDYRVQELRRMAAKTGMAINLKPMFWPTNAAPASYAVIAAGKAAGGDMGALRLSLIAVAMSFAALIASEMLSRWTSRRGARRT